MSIPTGVLTPEGVGKPGSGLALKETAQLHPSETNHPRNGMVYPGASVFQHMYHRTTQLRKELGNPEIICPRKRRHHFITQAQANPAMG